MKIRSFVALFLLLVLAASREAQAQTPSLSIVSRGEQSFLLSWPATASGYVLESAEELAGGPAWETAPEVPTAVNNEFQVVIVAGSSTRFFRLRSGPASGLPPDPATVAPPLSGADMADLASSTSFLYTGPNAIQTGVTDNTFVPTRVCVLRGRVTRRDGTVLPGVTITILNHPEFGRTSTRADGMYDIAVNGGGLLTVNYERAGYGSIHRQINTPWNDYVCLPDAVMITMDPVVNPITLGTNSPMQLARGSMQTDADGSRKATLIFPPGTCANLIVNGTPQSCSSLSVRATEFTVGPNGPSAMPAPLPGNSRYTYCVDLSADEAASAGATSVQFSQPLCFYVENFLNFPVGQTVPTGFYDRQKGAWVASQNGRVIKILGQAAGLAVLDTDGNGLADNAAQLAALGITDEERQHLASMYSTGQSLWRTCITHFSPWDCNWPGGPPPGAGPPDKSPKNKKDPDDPCDNKIGSVIKAESQAFGEDVNIVGTPYSLHYQSDRVAGNKEAYTVQIPLSDATIPPGLKRITLSVEVAGRVFKQDFPALLNQSTSFTWDGSDAYGRLVPGTQPISVKIGYVYDAFYYQPSEFDQAFAAFSNDTVTANRARDEVTLWRYWNGIVGNLLSKSIGLGGWTLNMHHAYDPRSRTLYLGDGNRRSTAGLDTTVISTFAGGGFAPGIGDGGQATAARLGVPSGLAVGPDGSLYIAEQVGQRVRRVAPDGIITTIAGSTNGLFCMISTNACGDGGPATQAVLNAPHGVAVAPDGTLYIADRASNRIRKVDTNGIITTIAGTGQFGYSGDGGPATQARLNGPFGVTVGPDGSIYIADTANSRVRRVGIDGIITTVAGGGSIPGPGVGDGGPATKAELSQPWRAAFDVDGNMFIVERGNVRIRRVGIDGIISTVAGMGFPSGYSGDGGPAMLAQFGQPEDIAIAPDGSFYIADRPNARVRLVGTEGIITTFAGNGQFGSSGDGGPATQAKLSEPIGLALGPDGSLYEADWFNQRVRRISSALPGFSVTEAVIASDDGKEVYVFDNSGQHLRTLDAFTKAVRYQFAYDTQGRLSTVTDGDNNVTAVERDAGGNPIGIVGPYGQRTALTVDAHGYLATVKNPANEQTSFGYTADGSLTSMTSPRNDAWVITYDNLGRLVSDSDPANGFKGLTRTETSDSFTIALGTALQRTNRYEVIDLPSGARKRIHTFPTGLQVERLDGADGTLTNRSPDGVVTTVVLGPDPRWGMLAPLASALTTITPGGLTNVISTQRTVKLATPSDPFSLVTSTEINDLNGRKYTSTYTAATRTTTTTTPAGRKVLTTYDSLMRPTQEQIGGLAATAYTYDNRGRISALVVGSGAQARTNRFVYNADGYPRNVIDQLGRSLMIDYDAAGRIMKQTLPDNRVIGFGYDASGNLASVTPPERPAHTFSHSPVNLQTLYAPPPVLPGNNSTRYDYNLDREFTIETRPDTQIVHFDYTASGCNCDRLNSVVQPRGTNIYSYDSQTGNLASIAAPGGINLMFAYDGNLLRTETWSGPVAGSVGYTYDNDFRPSTNTVNGRNPIALRYDLDGFLTQAGAVTLIRDAQSGLIKSSALGGVSNVWNYNEFAEPTNSRAFYNTTTLYAVQYVRDAAGRITRKTETIGGVTDEFDYSYDPTDRLVGVSKNGVINSTYSYDGNDNRLSFTGSGGMQAGTFDDQDRLTQYGAATYTYTANGELRTKSAAGQTTTYAYDLLGNLITVTLPSTAQIEYVIDGRDRRIGKKVNGSLTQAFLFDSQSRLVAELDSAGNVVSRFVYGTRSNAPDYMIKGNVTYGFVTDHLGSPRLIVDVSTGQIVHRLDYDEFGRVLTDTAPGFQPFGFAGGLYDRDTKLVRFGARDCDPETGRWTAKDPIRFGGGELNLYAYVANDPVNTIDPSGLDGLSPGDAKKALKWSKDALKKDKPPGPKNEYEQLQKKLNDPCKSQKSAFDFSNPLKNLFNKASDALFGK